MKNIFIAIILVLLISSCDKLTYTTSKQGQINVIIAKPEQVLIFHKERPQKPFEEIGVLHFTGRRNQTKLDNLLKIEVSKQGGNAIIDIKRHKVGLIATVVKIKE